MPTNPPLALIEALTSPPDPPRRQGLNLLSVDGGGHAGEMPSAEAKRFRALAHYFERRARRCRSNDRANERTRFEAIAEEYRRLAREQDATDAGRRSPNHQHVVTTK